MTPCIIDTDAGPDDLMALAFLLVDPAVRIEAITTAYGLANTERAAANILRVLALCGRDDIPVFVGQDRPLRGSAAFPDRWRRLSNTLPGVSLPMMRSAVQLMPAADYLRQRVQKRAAPIRILALGALTNVAAICDLPCPALETTVIMGGAFRVPGNVIDSGEFISPTGSAEWNMFADPLAARKVLSSELDLLVIPLDATNQVPVTTDFIDAFALIRPSPLHRLVCELLATVRPYASIGTYYAWDPLAAAALVDPAVVSTSRHAIAVSPGCGTTRFTQAGPRKSVALSADRKRWHAVFRRAFA